MSNYKFKTTNIRGKQYVEVNERIKFFRQEEQYKNWGIHTEFPMLNEVECLCRASIVDSDGHTVAVGHAHEVRTASNINKTSYVENCETSAVGRALAMLGIGIDTSIASANEVETAIAQSEQPRDTKPSSPAKKAGNVKEEVSIMDKAVDYLKKSSDRSKAYDLVISKYGSELSEKQKAGLKKFVK
ncbi:MAG: hypothetical protein Unbinned4409contig1001_52 [Prokaryotic dsDNA virus sp.]|nr:MAG: hypothetical protein Unbinned4409contig1001_52 [Prokaryotic dsDNA virus sp.]